MTTRLRESVCGILVDNEFSGLCHGNLYAYLDGFESKHIDTRGSRILLIEGGVGKSWWSPIQKLHVRAELMTVEVSLLQAQIPQRDLSRIAALLGGNGKIFGTRQGYDRSSLRFSWMDGQWRDRGTARGRTDDTKDDMGNEVVQAVRVRCGTLEERILIPWP